jgi:hypothetical protein
LANITYDVVALSVTIYFNKWGDHDHDGMMFALAQNEAKINEYKAYLAASPDATDESRTSHPHYALIRPLVLRACAGDTVTVRFRNQIRGRQVGVHLVGGPYVDGVKNSDGAWVGRNPSSLAAFGEERVYQWRCDNEGVFVFHDAGNWSGMQDGTNLHGLFGALVVEPEGTLWRNSETGEYASAGVGAPEGGSDGWLGDGLYVDIVPKESRNGTKPTPWLDKPVKHPEGSPPPLDPDSPPGPARTARLPGRPRKCFREYVIFFHDEVEFLPSHREHPEDPCHARTDLCGNAPPTEHRTHPLMTISYRSEPMVARQRQLWGLIASGQLKAPVVHEEQHHSSWLFGDPATPVLKAYIGDPVRIRLVHTAVKETHVFHLHVYSWYHDPYDTASPIIDAISLGPQTGHTIVPLWGAGNRQGATGDVIWHCHLYPHFHEGMWGLFRTFDRLQDGKNAYPDGTPILALTPLPDREAPPTYAVAGPGFPSFIAGRARQRSPLPPWVNENIPEGLDYRAPSALESARLNALSGDSRAWINKNPIPGWMFNSFVLPAAGTDLADPRLWKEDPWTELPGIGRVTTRRRDRDVLALAVEARRLMYNRHCWHDPEGHVFLPSPPRIDSPQAPPFVMNTRGQHDFAHADCAGHAGGHEHAEGHADVGTPRGDGYESNRSPLFFRSNHGDVLFIELENRLPRAFCSSPFDEPLPPCEAYTVPVSATDGYHGSDGTWNLGAKDFTADPHWRADTTPPMQCGQHVHLVKFDPLVCDGASTGWNYLSGPRAPYWDESRAVWRYLRMRYVWWVDEEFGVVFTHDHLFANFRQKRGLFGAMIAEPHGARYFAERTGGGSGLARTEARFGDRAVVQVGSERFREVCIGLGDFVPLYDRRGSALNPPEAPGGHSDHGVVGINYRSAPIAERTVGLHDTAYPPQAPERDPANAFSSRVWGDPDTPLFESRPGDPLRIRLVQGSHEEQHSFQVHGMRWRRFRGNPSSPLRNQQTLGISEQFTFDVSNAYAAGDYLYKFATADDLWMGAWGILRVSDGAHAVPALEGPSGGRLGTAPNIPSGAPVRRFRVIAQDQEIIYCQNPPLSDPFGLVYWLESAPPVGDSLAELSSAGVAALAAPSVKRPLILRCNLGDLVEVELWNKIPSHLVVEPQAPRVPVERVERAVSARVSMHADLLSYRVEENDGTNVGHNPDQTLAGRVMSGGAALYAARTYRWYADVAGPVLLQDMADFRNHRHHGLVGALIVEPAGASWTQHHPDHATVSQGGQSFEELVVIIQDGLRHFLFGNLSLPLGDPPGDPGELGPDPTDQGQKAFNYRSQPIGRPSWMHQPQVPSTSPGEPLWKPSVPIFELKDGSAPRVQVHVVTAADKPRNHVFTVHGQLWREWPTTGSPLRVGSVTSLSSGSVATLAFDLPPDEGDYAFRSGALRWAVPQGLWGIIRRG